MLESIRLNFKIHGFSVFNLKNSRKSVCFYPKKSIKKSPKYITGKKKKNDTAYKFPN